MTLNLRESPSPPPPNPTLKEIFRVYSMSNKKKTLFLFVKDGLFCWNGTLGTESYNLVNCTALGGDTCKVISKLPFGFLILGILRKIVIVH